MINQKRQLDWEQYARLFGGKYFQEKNKPLLSQHGNQGKTKTLTVKGGNNQNIELIFENGLLIDVIE